MSLIMGFQFISVTENVCKSSSYQTLIYQFEKPKTEQDASWAFYYTYWKPFWWITRAGSFICFLGSENIIILCWRVFNLWFIKKNVHPYFTPNSYLKIPNFQAPERPTANYFGRCLAEQLFKLGALMTTCYTSLCFDLSLYVLMLQLVH